MITGLGIPTNPENSRLRLEVESFPGLALKLTRVQGKQFLWGQAALLHLDLLLQGKTIPPHTTNRIQVHNKQMNSHEPKLTHG